MSPEENKAKVRRHVEAWNNDPAIASGKSDRRVVRAESDKYAQVMR